MVKSRTKSNVYGIVRKNLHLVYTYNRNLRYVSVIRRFQNQAPELHTVSHVLPKLDWQMKS